MEKNYFIGMDVSKATLDVAIVVEKEVVYQQQISNSSTGLKQCLKTLQKTLPEFDISRAVICMEHTGIYNHHALSYLHSIGADLCLESAVQIKLSLGLQRGKNDRIDSVRIARYAYKNREELKFWQPKRSVVEELNRLTVLRDRLLQAKNQLVVSYEEMRQFDKSAATRVKALSKSSMEALARDIDRVETAIEELIRQDEELTRLFKLITSVQGIGKVTAAALIVTTNEFKDIREAKPYACYAGVAPFEHSSGIKKGRAGVSQKANKQIKCLLHMAALTAIVYNNDLRAYYERKLKENKNKMVIINAVRNKLLHRVFSCVKRNTPYEKIYASALV
jgi:transposase